MIKWFQRCYYSFKIDNLQRPSGKRVRSVIMIIQKMFMDFYTRCLEGQPLVEALNKGIMMLARWVYAIVIKPVERSDNNV